MIGYLQGQIIDVSNDGHVLLGVKSGTDCVGYAVTVPAHPRYAALARGGRAVFFIHTHVREDALDLYGFLSADEKELFLTLLKVSGIGPKAATGILSHVEPRELVRFILDGDKDGLTRLPGIGKKTADRLVLELREPIQKKLENGMPMPAERPSAAESGVHEASAQAVVIQDVRSALSGLGYREAEVMAAIEHARAQEIKGGAEAWIRVALRWLGSERRARSLEGMPS